MLCLCLQPLKTSIRLDLTGAGTLGDKRRFSEDDFPALFSMNTSIVFGPQVDLPYGFGFHGDIIHHDLLSCIERIKGLQTAMAAGSLEPTKVDNIRASIVSRLISLQQTCQAFGPIAEGCRVAAYVVCDTCVVSSGKSSFVSWRLSESLTHILAETIGSEDWAYRRDLLLWLVLVGASCARTEKWPSSAPGSPYEDIMARLLLDASTWVNREEGSLILLGATQGYIYDQVWLNNRHLIPHWADLERLLTQSEALNAGASGS